MIKKDVAKSLSRGYDRNLLAVNNIQRSIGDWSDPTKAVYDWWVNDIIDPQKLGIGVGLQAPAQEVPLHLHGHMAESRGCALIPWKECRKALRAIPADKSRLKIWALPDSLAEYDQTDRVRLSKISLYAATFNEATSMTEEEMLGLYSWGTIIDFTVKKVASKPEYPAAGLTYEILGANERGIALLESLLRSQPKLRRQY